MNIYLYNTLTQKKNIFHPINNKLVTMYLCGPTVYNPPHIGNARPSVIFDVLYRLLSLSYKVKYIRNITDIDDKIITIAKKNKEHISKLTDRIIKIYHKNMKDLGVLSPTIEPKATEHINYMIELIDKLIKKGNAYVSQNHVLFDISSHKNYGSLSHRKKEDMISGARVEIGVYKKDPYDFILWKPSSPELPGWESPWGRGRPGWHIECSAMSQKYLGSSFDIHGGGQDLIFPHHENELAQSRAINGENSFARYWIHNGILTVDGEKMSKSLGNFITIQDLLRKNQGEVIRLALLFTHYRQPLNWTKKLIDQSKSLLNRLYRILKQHKNYIINNDDVDKNFLEIISDDLNTPAAITKLHELTIQLNKEKSLEKRIKLIGLLKARAKILGILEKNPSEWFQSSPKKTLDENSIKNLIDARDKARNKKDYKKADEIKEELLKNKIIIEDTPQGTTWRYK